jgi:hypothetical protein
MRLRDADPRNPEAVETANSPFVREKFRGIVQLRARQVEVLALLSPPASSTIPLFSSVAV